MVESHEQTMAVTQPKTNIMAVISLVFAVLGILLTWWIPLLPQIIAVITGHLARSQIRKSNGAESGDGVALAGMIIGYVMIVLGLIPIVFFGGLALYFA